MQFGAGLCAAQTSAVTWLCHRL